SAPDGLVSIQISTVCGGGGTASGTAIVASGTTAAATAASITTARRAAGPPIIIDTVTTTAAITTEMPATQARMRSGLRFCARGGGRMRERWVERDGSSSSAVTSAISASVVA